MSRLRLVVLLSGGLLVMLSVVVLRAETTACNFEISRQEVRADELRLELRAKELELARFRDPAEIRKRLAQNRLDSAPHTPQPTPAPKPKRGNG